MITPAVGASNQEIIRVVTLNPATYRGYFYDHELGLYYLQSRYYDPETGRFINVDAFCDSGTSIVGTNVFVYCNNNAIIYLDPNGYYAITNSFSIGNQKEPDLLSDIQDQYHFDPNHSRNPRRIISVYRMWVRSGIATFLAEPFYPNGIRFYRHFRTGKGKTLYYDYQEAMDGDNEIGRVVGTAFVDLLYYIEQHFSQGDLKNNDYVCLNGYLTITASSQDWWYALGTHRVWLKAKFIFNSNANIMRITLYVVAKDRYNFDKGGTGIIGALSKWNGTFVEFGYAKFFNSVGTINSTFEWHRGTYV